MHAYLSLADIGWGRRRFNYANEMLSQISFLNQSVWTISNIRSRVYFGFLLEAQTTKSRRNSDAF